jgi:Glycosyltransferase family 87
MHHPEKDHGSMRLFWNRPATILALIGLAAFVFLRGIVPALSKLDADFPGYFTAAKIVASGRNVEPLYDDSWFQEQIRRYGMESAENPGKFAPFPPPTALLLVPLAHLEPLNALRVVCAVSVLCLIGSIFLLARILSWNVAESAVFILLSGHAVVNGLRLGQPYILVSSLCILGYYAYLKGRPLLAGACLGLFVPVKYYPVIFLAYFAFRKEWKALVGGAIAILAVTLLSIGVLGWKIHQIFLMSVFGSHLAGHLSLKDSAPPFTAVYQSFDTLFNRLFILDPTRNPQPLWPSPLLPFWSSAIVKVAILLAAAATLIKLARRCAATAAAPSLGILGILVLLIAPATATYHCVLLWLPVGLLINYFLSQGARLPAYFILSVYALIGLFPSRLTYPFEGRGGLTVLAYPRLFLLLAMFIVALLWIARPGKGEVRGAGLPGPAGLRS